MLEHVVFSGLLIVEKSLEVLCKPANEREREREIVIMRKTHLEEERLQLRVGLTLMINVKGH